MVNKPDVVGSGHVQKPPDPKDNGLRADDHMEGVGFGSAAGNQVTGRDLRHVEQLAQSAPLVSAGDVSVEEQKEVQIKFLPKNLPSPSNDSNTDKKEQLPDNVSADQPQ